MDWSSLFPYQRHHLIPTYNILQPVPCTFSPLPLIEWSTWILGDVLIPQLPIPSVCGFWLLFYSSHVLTSNILQRVICLALGPKKRPVQLAMPPELLRVAVAQLCCPTAWHNGCRSPYTHQGGPSPSPKAQRFVCLSLGFPILALEGTSKHGSFFSYRFLLRRAQAAFT